jgi:hypothetical protein
MGSTNNIYNNFTDEEKKWLNFKNGDTIKFVNQTGAEKLFYIKEFATDTVTEMDKFRTSCDVQHLTRVTVGIESLPDSCTNCMASNRFVFEKSSSGLYIVISFKDIWGYSVEDICNDSVDVRGKMINKVAVIALTPAELQSNTWQKIIKYYYSRDYGVVKFVERDGTVWERVLG